jgi:hypothetical protein
VLEARRRNPDWGPQRLVDEAARAGLERVPFRSDIYGALRRLDLGLGPNERRGVNRRSGTPSDLSAQPSGRAESMTPLEAVGERKSTVDPPR